jgi:hypothetical protein
MGWKVGYRSRGTHQESFRHSIVELTGSAASQGVGRSVGSVSCDNAELALIISYYCGDGHSGRRIGRQVAVTVISAKLHSFADNL